MLRIIALAVDGSDRAQSAVPVAAELARLASGKVVVLHVREHDVTSGQLWELETAEQAEAVVKQTESDLQKAGASAECVVIRTLHGKVAKAIVDGARQHKADMIVMGSRGLSDKAGIVLGSVAHEVIHLSDMPVLVTR